MVHMLSTSLGIADMYTFLMNTWNALPENYQQRVYSHTRAIVKHQIQMADTPLPAVVIRARTVMMRMQMRKENHHKPMMD
jgi:hypothetical protein